MIDAEIFMKNSPFQTSHNVTHNISNTTPELLKCQLQEQSLAQIQQAHPLESQFAESAFNAHLQKVLNEGSFMFDDDSDENDEFSNEDQSSGLSSPSSTVSSSWKAVASARDQSYSNLRVLIENSVFDTSKITPTYILSLSQLKSLKQKIAEETELKEYLQEKCLLSNQICSMLLSGVDSTLADLDTSLLVSVLKQMSDLQSRLMKVCKDLDQHSRQLTNHNLACLVSGYIEDVRLSNLKRTKTFDTEPPKPKDASSLRAFEALFSHIASLAAQKDVALPEYPTESATDSLQDKISWASMCIDALSSVSSSSSVAATDSPGFYDPKDDTIVKDHSFLCTSPYEVYQKGVSSEKVLSEYKLALNDLKFSQEFFTKEYTYLKENSLKTIREYKRRNAFLEKELSRLQNSSSAAPPIPSRDSLRFKEHEIFKLRRELNSMKIDMMGSTSQTPPTTANPSLLSFLGTEDDDEPVSSPMSSPPSSKAASTAILRKEFKKIVEDIQDQYEIELEEERTRRRDLESRIQKMSIR